MKEIEEVKILGIITHEVSSPNNEGSLYKIQFKLNIIPCEKWKEFFINAWNHPQRFTTMHRPNIASVHMDVITLDGTTVEEVRDYHHDTLILSVKFANNEIKKEQEKRNHHEEQERIRAENHKKKIEEFSKIIKFND